MSPATQSFLLVAILAANIGVSAFFRARARRQETIPRSREERGLRLGRLAVALPLLATLAATALYPRALEWAAMPIPPLWRWFGAVLGFAVVPLNVWVLRSLGDNVSETVLTKETHELVTHGPYRWVRHPLYSSGFLLLVSLALVTASALLAAFALLAIALVRWVVVPREEAELVARFGESYRALRRRTGALVPRLGRRAAR